MPVPLSPEQAAFLQSPVSINVAATGSDGWPVVCRAQGCSVARDRHSVTLLLSARQASAVLAALTANGAIAAVFSRPASHATLQIKAHGATRVPLTAAHRACHARYSSRLGDELAGLGYGSDLVQGLKLMLSSGDLVALRLSPEVIFDQTPGPDAGRVLARA
ncbi:MAG: hypothetical protein WAK92_12520 [Thiobacillus sp.]